MREGRIQYLRRLLPFFGLALLIAAVAAPTANALPVAGRYPSGITALETPNSSERELLEAFNAARADKGMKALEWESILSAIAREHSQDMADYEYIDYFSPRLGTLTYRQHRAGVSAPNSAYAIFRVASVDDVIALLSRKDSPFHLQPATQIGIGIVSKGLLPKKLYVTLIAGEKVSSIEPFPTMPEYGKGYWLKGNIDTEFKNPHLIITLPDGEVIETPLEIDEQGSFKTIVKFNRGKGEYIVEIVAAGPEGPKVLELMRCYAGVDYPPPDENRNNGAAPVDLRRAEKLMFGMVNKARAEANLPPLTYDENLADVARLHSQDMADHNFFAHISPTKGTLEDRLNRADINAQKFTENLASDVNLQAAHEGLMESPGHRKNILDDEVDHIGIGIVRTAKGQLFITQVFSQDFPTYDPDTLVKDLLAAANRKRAALGRSTLQKNTTLTRIALENSKAMANLGKHDHTRAQELLKEEKLPYAVQLAVFQSGAPITVDQVEVLLEKEYRYIGLGIVQTTTEDGARYLWTTLLLGKP